MTEKKEKSSDYISTILMLGSFFAAGLLLVGLGMLLVQTPSQNGLTPLVRPDFSNVLRHLLRGEPVGIVSLGILVMMITPFLRVVVAIFSFFWERDFKYAAVAFGVMLILLLTIVPSLL